MLDDNSGQRFDAAQILRIDGEEISVFVRKRLQERTLSSLVAQLNRKALMAEDAERKEAQQALEHLGFI